MTKSFHVNFTIAPTDLLHKAKSIAGASGWILSGDTDSGKFSRNGTSGHYRRNGNSLLITMTSKPHLTTWSDVEKELRSIF